MTDISNLASDPALVAQRSFFADVLGTRPLAQGVSLTPIGPAELTLTEIRTARSTTIAVVFWVHGGGYVAGTVRQSIGPAANVALAASVQTIAPDYPLAPEHPYPAALDHLISGYRWVLDHAGAERVIVAGESAGGGLALALLQRARDEGLASPVALILASPALDLTGSGETFCSRADDDPVLTPDGLAANYAMYAGDVALDDPRVSPLFGDLTGLPPVYIQVGTTEILLDDAIRLASRAAHAEADVILDVVRGGTHGLQAGDTTQAHAAVGRLAAFIRDVVQA